MMPTNTNHNYHHHDHHHHDSSNGSMIILPTAPLFPFLVMALPINCDREGWMMEDARLLLLVVVGQVLAAIVVLCKKRQRMVATTRWVLALVWQAWLDGTLVFTTGMNLVNESLNACLSFASSEASPVMVAMVSKQSED